MKKIWAFLLILSLVITAVTGCVKKNSPQETPPEQQEPQEQNQQAIDRPKTKEGVLTIEGQKEEIPLNLYEGKIIPFSTYIPEHDFTVEEAGSEEEGTVFFFTNFNDNKNEKAYISIYMYPEEVKTSEQAVSEITGENGMAKVNEWDIAEPDSKRFNWSIREYHFTHQPYTGSIYLGKHGDRYFRFVLHYPVEMGDGFEPRASIIIDEFYWIDIGEFPDQE